MNKLLLPVHIKDPNGKRSVNYIDAKGKIHLQLDVQIGFGLLGFFGFVLKNDHLYLIDNQGQFKVSINANRAQNDHHCSCVRVQNNQSLWGVCDESGTMVIECKYHSISPITSGYFTAVNNHNDFFSLYDLNNNLLIKDVCSVGCIVSDGVIAGNSWEKVGLCGYKSLDGAWLSPQNYDQLCDLNNGIGVGVTMNNKNKRRCFLIEKNGNVLTEVEGVKGIARHFSEGLLPCFGRAWAGYLNTQGKVVIRNNFQLVEDMVDGAAPVKMDGKWGLINPKGEFIIKPTYGGFEEQRGPFKIFREKNSFLSKKIIVNSQGEEIATEDLFG